MLRVLRQRWLTWVFVLLVGGVFVFFMGLGQPLTGGPAAGTVVEVGDRRFDLRDFERVRAGREREYQQLVGTDYDSRKAASFLDSFAVSALLELGILADEAERLGLRVSDEEIRRVVRSYQAFQDGEGRFQPELARDYAEYEYGTEQIFVRWLRGELLSQQLRRLLYQSARVSEAAARQAARQRLEQIRLAFVALGGKTPVEAPEVTDEQVGDFLSERESDARALYDERIDQYQTPERVRARHILLRVEPGASEERIEFVRRRAEEVLARIREGAHFADVALEVSEDPGSKSQGGDLGLFARGQMVKPFEDVAFSLEPGTVSDLVRTDFGFHIIRVEERRPAEHRGFAELREELARELLEKESRGGAARAVAERLSAAIRGGGSLEQAARDEGLTLERTALLRRRPDGYIPDLGASPEFSAAAFSLSADRPSSDRIFEVGDAVVLIQLLERVEPDPDALEAQVAEERSRLLEQKRLQQIQGWVGARRTELADEGRLAVNLEALPIRR